MDEVKKKLTEMTINRGMGFAGALEALTRGEKVTRTGWNNHDFPHLKLLTDDTIMMACMKYSKTARKLVSVGWNDWVPRPSDFVMDDWVVVPK